MRRCDVRGGSRTWRGNEKIYPTRMSGGRLGAAHIYQVGRFSLSAFPLIPTPPSTFNTSRRLRISNSQYAGEFFQRLSASFEY